MRKTPDLDGSAPDRASAGELDDLPRALRDGTRMESLRDARLRRALDWWTGLERDNGSAVPDRAQIDPLTIPDLLPYCLLWNVTDGAEGRLHYVCRLAGTILCEMYGGEARGLTLEQMFATEAAGMRREFDVAILHGCPFHAAHRMTWADRPYYRYYRLLLPFTHRAAATPDSAPASLAAGHELRRPVLLMSIISFVPE